jgi:hypothetical protein
MRLRGLFGGLALALWPVVLSVSQSTPSVLSPDLRAHLTTERFQIVTAIRGTPLGVRDAMRELFGGPSLDIAEPGAPFQGTGPAENLTLASRRLVVAGCSMDHCLVYYELAGAARTWKVALFHWTPEKTRFEFGGTAAPGLKTIDDVRTAVLSGAVKSEAGSF